MRKLSIFLVLVFASATIAQNPASETHATNRPQVVQGRPNVLVDSAGWVLGIPDKLLLWNSKVKNHQPTGSTRQEVVEYLEYNSLRTTKVRINQYNPGDEWRRLVSNKRVAPAWRYTVGAFRVLGETVLPGRIFGQDNYNPYTDTVNIYSDVPALALEQCAFAKDVHSRDLPGTYAFVQSLPVANLYHEKINKDDVMSYVEMNGSREQRLSTQRVLAPQYGVEVGDAIGQVVPGGEPLFQVAGAIIGHGVASAKR